MTGVTKLISNITFNEYQNMIKNKIIPSPKFTKHIVHNGCFRPQGVLPTTYGAMIESLIIDYIKGDKYDPMSIFYYQKKYPTIKIHELLGDQPMTVDQMITILLPEGFRDYIGQIITFHSSIISKLRIRHPESKISGEIDLLYDDTIMDIKTYTSSANSYSNYLQLLTYHAMIDHTVKSIIIYNPLLGEIHMMDVMEKPVRLLKYLSK